MTLRRREVLSYGLAGLGAGLAGCLDEETPVDPTIGDVTSYKYDRRNSGYAADHRGPRESVTEWWSKELTLGYNTPLVKEGVIYTADIHGGVFALNAVDGSMIWDTEVEVGVSSRLELVEELLLIPTWGGELVGLDRESGSEQWTAEIDELFRLTGPTVVEDLCIIPDDSGSLYAFDLEDGSREWVFDNERAMAGPPAVADTSLYLTDGKGTIFAVDWRDGSVQWSLELGRRVGFESVLTPDLDLLVMTEVSELDETRDPRVEVGLVAVDTDTQAKKWEFSAYGNRPLISPSVANGVAYLAMETGGADVPALYAIDVDTGGELWASHRNHRLVSGFSPPVVTDDRLYVGADEETYQALDPEDGAEHWSLDVDYPTISPPVVTDDYLFVPARGGSDEGTLYAYKEE